MTVTIHRPHGNYWGSDIAVTSYAVEGGVVFRGSIYAKGVIVERVATQDEIDRAGGDHVFRTLIAQLVAEAVWRKN